MELIWVWMREYRSKRINIKKAKDNLPKNYTEPEDMKTFLSAVTSDIKDPQNRITEKSN